MLKKMTVYSQFNSFKNLRLVQISDLHYSYSKDNKLLQKAMKQIDTLNPQYIIFNGDIIQDAAIYDKDLLRNIASLAEICPVIVAIGNHELISRVDNKWIKYRSTMLDFLDKIPNVSVLDNSILEFQDIRFIGATLPYEWFEVDKDYENESMKVAQLFNKQDGSKYTCLLIHDPTIISYMLQDKFFKPYFNNINLTLSGHNHGGLIPPLLDKIVPPNSGFVVENGGLKFKDGVRGKMNFNGMDFYIGDALYTPPKHLVLSKIIKPLYPPVINVVDIEKTR